MRILVTRPEPDAQIFADALQARGHEPIFEPLLTIEPKVLTLPSFEGFQALVFTSANGVRAFAGLSEERKLPVFAVGPASAQCAKEFGFQSVTKGSGDAAQLVSMIERHLDPAKGRLFHGAGAVLAGDLKDALEQSGYQIERMVLYNAQAREAFSDRVIEAFSGAGNMAHRIEGATFFSPRTARTFVSLTKHAALDKLLGSVKAYCLSKPVAEALRSLSLQGILVAEEPNQEALLNLMDE